MGRLFKGDLVDDSMVHGLEGRVELIEEIVELFEKNPFVLGQDWKEISKAVLDVELETLPQLRDYLESLDADDLNTAKLKLDNYIVSLKKLKVN